jgi:hypothetical protein|tara:strand:- start:273 stop:488 length:216 start_codon:yes stop_codon:yes gene_type:complete
MSKIQEKITPLMDELQSMMESNAHLEDLHNVVTKMAQVNVYRSYMNDEDKDYLEGIEWFLEEYPEGRTWKN